jgi:hypothetical protein
MGIFEAIEPAGFVLLFYHRPNLARSAILPPERPREGRTSGDMNSTELLKQPGVEATVSGSKSGQIHFGKPIEKNLGSLKVFRNSGNI